jgi:hypothetical protein
MNGKPKKALSYSASKRERQAAWANHCREKAMSGDQSNRAATIIPSGASIKVLSWPSF